MDNNALDVCSIILSKHVLVISIAELMKQVLIYSLVIYDYSLDVLGRMMHI